MTDPYTLPNGTLRNRLGITDVDALAAVEHDVVTRRGFELAVNPVVGRFDLAHLQAIHRRLFGDLYDWAGEIRTVDISKEGNAFCAARFIATAADDVFATVPAMRTQLEHDARIPVAAGDLYGDLNALHPFREGNGRAQRAFLQQLFAVHDITLDWSRITPDGNLHASRAGHRGDTSGLHACLLVAALQPVPVEHARWNTIVRTRPGIGPDRTIRRGRDGPALS